MNKVLHLTLTKEWFDQVLCGKKKVEYREVKPYWQKRLLDKHGMPKPFDVIIFRNGYARNAPTMKVEFLKLGITRRFEIHLGRILGTSNV